MRHRRHFRKLNRTSEHRLALRRNLAQSLIEHGRVTTTIAKAKDVRPFFERLVTLAIKTRRYASSDPAASLRARRRIHHLLSDRSMVPAEHRAAYEEMSDAVRAKTMRMVSGRRYRTGAPRGRLAFTGESVTHRLIETVAADLQDRPGGYTRLIRLASWRKGDNSELAMLQLVGQEEPPTSLTKPGKTGRQRRADARYAAAIKGAKGRARSGKSSPVDNAPPPEKPVESVDEAQANPDGPTSESENSSEA